MKKLLVIFAVLASVSSVSFAAAGLVSMNKAQAIKELSDKTITTISAVTLNGKVISDSFTGYFSKDGKTNGKLATKPADGPQVDQGKWMVKSNGMVCITWDHWNNAKEKCVNFYKLNNALLITNAGHGFESLVLDDEIQSGNQMSS
ncbi:MAG: hypothetical protein SFW66_05745 [Gammaproteobacteria bacterium]|nr:hypothetical protein [Gammaproteobacteria bacterium]